MPNETASTYSLAIFTRPASEALLPYKTLLAIKPRYDTIAVLKHIKIICPSLHTSHSLTFPPSLPPALRSSVVRSISLRCCSLHLISKPWKRNNKYAAVIPGLFFLALKRDRERKKQRKRERRWREEEGGKEGREREQSQVSTPPLRL